MSDKAEHHPHPDADHHGHEHGSAHGHEHHHGGLGHVHAAPGRLGTALALNATFTVIELIGAWLTNSTAIAADAIHDLGDTLSLGLAWILEGTAGRGASDRFTFGLRRLSVVAALVNAVVLLAGGVVVLTEALPRLVDPPEADPVGMALLAVLGVAVNGVAAWRTHEGGTLNEQVVTWHLVEDTFGWVAVLVVSGVMMLGDLPILDPLLAVAITLFISFNALRMAWRSLQVFLQGVPAASDVASLREAAAQVQGVVDLAHVHLWSLDGERHVLTGHLVLRAGVDWEEAVTAREAVRTRLADLGVGHVTLEVHREGASVTRCEAPSHDHDHDHDAA